MLNQALERLHVLDPCSKCRFFKAIIDFHAGFQWKSTFLLELFMRKMFVCLAKSWKHGNYCIAGKEVVRTNDRYIVKNWFRPVLDGENSAVPLHDVRFEIGYLVSCDVECALKSGHQTENYILSKKPNWKIVGKLSDSVVKSLADNPAQLWSNGFNSSLGLNDKVPEHLFEECKNSLHMIRLDCADVICVKKESYQKEYTQRRLVFVYNSSHYNLPITDPCLSSMYANLSPGESAHIGPCLITVSLGEPYAGSIYKLVAGYISL